jgi:hypothetical protein
MIGGRGEEQGQREQGTQWVDKGSQPCQRGKRKKGENKWENIEHSIKGVFADLDK